VNATPETFPSGGPDKANPFVRRGWKAAALRSEMAELPKDKYSVTRLFISHMIVDGKTVMTFSL
jgi:hypothetical protein